MSESQLSCDIAEWLINNKEEIQRAVDTARIAAKWLHPNNMHDVYQHAYRNSLLDYLSYFIAVQLNLHFDAVYDIIDAEYITKVLGADFLEIPRSKYDSY